MRSFSSFAVRFRDTTTRFRLGAALAAAALLALFAAGAGAQIVLNEIMYNTPDSPDVEWVELVNVSAAAVDLDGWYLLDEDDGHVPCALAGVLDPGAFLVVAGDDTLFAAAYPDVENVNPNVFGMGPDGWNLGNGGDAIRLYDDDDELADRVDFDDASPWPTAPDGDGPSLELLNPALDNASAVSWAASIAAGGSPGAPNTVYVNDQPPAVGALSRDILLPGPADTVTVTARAFDDDSLAAVLLYMDDGSGFTPAPMADDGLHGDGAPGDSLFGVRLAPRPFGALVRYYVLAEDGISQTATDPPDAPAAYHAYTVGYEPPMLTISEALAVNDSGAADEMGEREDWIEIRNGGPSPAALGGMFLTDDFDSPMKWALPDTTIPAGDHLLVWADGEPEEGPLHADFKLSAGGEEVGLFETTDHGNGRIHGFTFGPQSADISFGYLPGDNAPEYLDPPTPGASNASSSPYGEVCVNELFAASTASGGEDWLELWNRGGAAVGLGGWFLSDDTNEPERYRIADGTSLPAGAFLVFTESELGFAFSASGDEAVLLTAPDGATGVDYYDYGPQIAGASVGRWPDGTGFWSVMESPTPGAPNGDPVGVDESAAAAPPAAARIAANRPNPFNPTTTILFETLKRGRARIRVYDLGGRRVRSLVDASLEPGSHEARWDGRNDAGRPVAGGFYFARLETEGSSCAVKMLLLR
ncbi:MAG: lamin tail domain-containing protein [Candidatus Eisenbacteria bacterium]|nr:lamin tail domain-containing protein [Candidatus Eisenbacteria bacterium]